VTLRKNAAITHQTFYRGIPVPNAIVARFTYNKGTIDADVQVEIENSCALAFAEPMPGRKPWGVVQTLELFDEVLVKRLLALYSTFIPELGTKLTEAALTELA
jgi:hypothetical protein